MESTVILRSHTRNRLDLSSRGKPRGGFTLIELLVVIAIIGILSAVVLASLNTARTKGSDVGVKGNLHTVITQAGLFSANNNNLYGSFDNGSGGVATCPTSGTAGTSVFHDSTIENAIAAALLDSAGGITKCFANDTAYAVAVSRPDTTNSTYWCADSSGVSCGINSLIIGAACGSCASTQ